ncbi:MAG: hypothetical protein R6V10_04725 [bacterium]
MKKTLILLLGATLICSLGSMCEAPSGSGEEGMFSGDETSTATQTWDMLLYLEEEGICRDGLAGSGASDPDVPAVYFPGLTVSRSSYEVEGEIPEVNMLGYYLVPPEMTGSPAYELGSPVRVRFKYLADADGQGVNYFLVRIMDGDLFRVPLKATGREIAAGEPRTVDFSYTPASPDEFGLQFITGLSSGTDSIYLDELEVFAGDTLLFSDDFESGDYSARASLNSLIYRIPFFPLTPAGSVSLQDGLTLEGTNTLRFQGGRTFQLYGQGSETEDFSGFMVNYVRSGVSSSFYGESMFMDQGSVLMGDYYGVDNVTQTTCSESGFAVASVNPKGNADLSGDWTVSVQAECEEPDLFIPDPDTGGMLTYSAAPFYVQRVLMIHQGESFNSVYGDSISSVMGITSGNAGMFVFSWGDDNAARLMGSYDKETGVLAGQLQGQLPVGGQTCTISQGRFSVMVASP